MLTTDHAQLTSKHFYGVDGVGRGNFNWYYGTDADETYTSPQPEIQRLIDETGQNVEMSMQDSAIRTWLVDPSLRGEEAGSRRDVDAGRRAGDVLPRGRSLPAGLGRAPVAVDVVRVGLVAQARPGDREHDGRRLRTGRDRAAARQRELRRQG